MPSRQSLFANVFFGAARAMIVFLLCVTPAFWAEAQSDEESGEEEIEIAEGASTRRPVIDKIIAQNGIAYVVWPAPYVDEETLTAINLADSHVVWTRPLGNRSVRQFLSFGKFLYLRSEDNSAEIESIIRLDTGEIVTEHTQPVDISYAVAKPLSCDNYLISSRIYAAADGQLVCELPFKWSQGWTDGEAFYSLDPIEETPQFEEPGIRPRVLRRTRLATGTTNLTTTCDAIFDANMSLSIIAAKSDDVIFESSREYRRQARRPSRDWPPRSRRATKLPNSLIRYNAAQNTVVWQTPSPCPIAKASFREDGQLDCQCRCGLNLYGTFRTEGFERQPLVVNLDTGKLTPDAEWRDPFSCVRWYSGESPIFWAQRNANFTLAVYQLDARVGTRGVTMCMDSASGRLVWYHETFGILGLKPDVLEDYAVRPVQGGIEVIEVAAGKVHKIDPQFVGLNVRPIPPLHRTHPNVPEPSVSSPADDWWHDRLLMAIPGVPLLLWGIYRLSAWTHKVAPNSNRNTSPQSKL